MNTLRNNALKLYLRAGLVFALIGFSCAAPAMIVDSEFRTGGWVDEGTIALGPGHYSLALQIFSAGTAGPFIFGISNALEAFQVSVKSFGSASVLFLTPGGTFDYLVGGNAGDGAIFKATVVPAAVIPLPSALWLLGVAVSCWKTVESCVTARPCLAMSTPESRSAIPTSRSGSWLRSTHSRIRRS